MDQERAVDRVRPLQGLVALVLVIAGVALYLIIGGLLGIAPLYAGFAFSLYFGGIRQSAPSELPASLLGSLGGVLAGAGVAPTVVRTRRVGRRLARSDHWAGSSPARSWRSCPACSAQSGWRSRSA